MATDVDGVLPLEGTALSTAVTHADRLPRKGGMVISFDASFPVADGGLEN
jgi:hypothetical protein